MGLSEFCLKSFGFNPQESLRLQGLSPKEAEGYLETNLEATVNHLLEDLAVSLPYYYQLNENGDIINYPSSTPLYIDAEERRGLYQSGLKEALSLAQDHPQKLVFLYSPPGPVDFDKGFNPITGENYYKIGQLYLIWFDEGKLSNLALSVSKEGDWLIDYFLGADFARPNDHPNLISQTITSPIATNLSLEGFLDSLSENPEKIVYRNVHGEIFPCSKVIELIKKSLTGQLKPKIPAGDKTLQALSRFVVTEEYVIGAYLRTMGNWMRGKGVTQTPLGGGCGGGLVTVSLIDEILSNLSSPFREWKQSIIPSIFSSEEKSYSFDHEGTCVICHRGPKPLGPCQICQECDKKLS